MLARSCGGGLAERSNAAVLKTVVPKGIGGSNPSSSASFHRAIAAIVSAAEAGFGEVQVVPGSGLWVRSLQKHACDLVTERWLSGR